MTSVEFGIKTSTSSALPFVRESLRDGTALALSVDRQIGRLGVCRILIPSSSMAPAVIDARGRSFSRRATEELATNLFSACGAASALTLVVEDDLARRGDVLHGANYAFLGNRVIRWARVNDSARAATHLLRTGASGYPLNAFLCDADGSQLGLSEGASVAFSSCPSMADHVSAVIVSAFDGEAFLVLMTPEFDARLTSTDDTIRPNSLCESVARGKRTPSEPRRS